MGGNYIVGGYLLLRLSVLQALDWFFGASEMYYQNEDRKCARRLPVSLRTATDLKGRKYPNRKLMIYADNQAT
jgi:hypothetical protein